MYAARIFALGIEALLELSRSIEGSDCRKRDRGLRMGDFDFLSGVASATLSDLIK
ncbi:hypothetical protein [Ulvibacter sp. MAR_2010_11]|uniref:hypothetical protein n=1 Tax=Ulvibacter sp. MAR_2010_11 TaxID=1250229 RepID=UPI0012FDACBC|nr:hypothetical protein [Ulvibacter sp. MAR_2010_11]